MIFWVVVLLGCMTVWWLGPLGAIAAFLIVMLAAAVSE